MTHTTHTHKATLTASLERISAPVLLFSGALLMLQIASFYLLLPRFMKVPVAGSIVAADEIREKEQNLEEELATLEAKRKEVVLPTHDAAYDELKAKKRSGPTLKSITEQLDQAAALSSDVSDSIAITTVTLSTTDGTVSFSGDVRNVGLKSMTVLATFVEEVERLPIVTELERPAFKRVDDAHGNSHSPFAIRFHLAEVSDPETK